MPRRYPSSTVIEVLRLAETRSTAVDIARRTGLHPQTVRAWLRDPDVPRRARECDTCGGHHDVDALPGDSYAYLLGVYLGDGDLRRQGRTVALRVTLDAAYPGIIRAVCAAIQRVRGRPPTVRADHGGTACVRVTSTWNRWPCLLPQHGAGPKHRRPIRLDAWQQHIVDRHAAAFLRGLIHTDGWRGLNRVRVKGRDYAYPRYQFSSRSDDIRRLFCEACDVLGIAWRPWGRWHISIARREAVRRMDEFIGPKR